MDSPTSITDCHTASLETVDDVDDVDELYWELMFMPSKVVLTPDGRMWEVWVDLDDEALVVNELDAPGGRQLEFGSFTKAFKLLAGGWIMARR
jgi:hypothetical protein